jgi:hypothetical protein
MNSQEKEKLWELPSETNGMVLASFNISKQYIMRI